MVVVDYLLWLWLWRFMGLDVVSMYVCVFLLVVADVGSRWHGGGSVLLCFFGGFFNGLLCGGVVLAWLCRGWHGGGMVVVIMVVVAVAGRWLVGLLGGE